MRNLKNNESGFTLIEVLIAVLLLGIGLLSAAGMQTTAISGNAFAKDTALAIQLAEEMVDRIRVNSGNNPAIYNGIDSAAATCGGVEPAKGDCEQWKERMQDETLGLRRARGIVRVQGSYPYTDGKGIPIDYSATVTVTITWGAHWGVTSRSITLTTILETWVS